MQASIKDLKNNLSAYLKMVINGEELIITSHDHPVAKIVPLSEETHKFEDLHSLFLADIHNLHQKLGKIKLKKSMRETVLQRRKSERS